MRKFFSSITFKIVLAIAVVLAGLMVYSAANPGETSFIEKMLTVVAAPFQGIASSISSSVSTFWTNITSPHRIAKENEELKAEIADLKNQMVDFENYKNENERMKELLQIKEENPNLTLVSADIIGRDTDDYGTSFTIDKGSFSGVSLRDAVITPAGMVGVVTEVFPTSARVTTVLSTDLQIGARILRTRDTGVCGGVTSWALNSTMKLSYISRDSKVAAGDLVVTSGASGLYPEDLILGTVREVLSEPNGVSLYAVLETIENINDIKGVYVVTDFGVLEE
ncbi:MAG: rod shape-determining protein MreC [Oscillospiraceae bacterium]|nr:rod shape-determining protein MreC [Oscillospiraceae bacterium]